MCAVRSPDGGKTWGDKCLLLDGYNANFLGFIRLKSGRLVASAEHLMSQPGRWVVCSFVSDDSGQTWCRSNYIDLGGHGHHDGATEPTLAELSDGRVLMLIRTNLDRFWQALSEDGGRYWRTIQPTTLDASSSPGHLVRLQSGRLLFIWNRLNPESGPAPRGRRRVRRAKWRPRGSAKSCRPPFRRMTAGAGRARWLSLPGGRAYQLSACLRTAAGRVVDQRRLRLFERVGEPGSAPAENG